ncbi:MAG: DUF411 domain-containing protein [Bryobacteraceae bacterium]
MKMKIVLALLLSAGLQAAEPEITVFKTKTCGCCGKWVEHVRASGFKVTVKEVASTAEYQKQYGVPERLQSCHTAIVGGYTIEGHVPAADIQRLLKERPKAKGLAVPGMPAGSPGMEGARSDAYSVVKFDAAGAASVYRKYPHNE